MNANLLNKLREPVNALTHWAGVIATIIIFVPLLIWVHGQGLSFWPFVVFMASMVLLYTASASYHSFNPSEKGLLLLRKLDHAGIFLLIAGTYTPVVYYGLHGVWATATLAFIWGVAILGIILKLITMKLPRWVSVALYLAMGWTAAILLPQLAHALPKAAIFWMALGGVIYTAGAVVYGTKRINPLPGVFGFHEIWHIFVLSGSFAHVAMMFNLR